MRNRHHCVPDRPGNPVPPAEAHAVAGLRPASPVPAHGCGEGGRLSGVALNYRLQFGLILLTSDIVWRISLLKHGYWQPNNRRGESGFISTGGSGGCRLPGAPGMGHVSRERHTRPFQGRCQKGSPWAVRALPEWAIRNAGPGRPTPALMDASIMGEQHNLLEGGWVSGWYLYSILNLECRGTRQNSVASAYPGSQISHIDVPFLLQSSGFSLAARRKPPEFWRCQISDDQIQYEHLLVERAPLKERQPANDIVQGIAVR